MKNLKKKLKNYLKESTPKQLRAEINKRKHLQEVKDSKFLTGKRYDSVEDLIKDTFPKGKFKTSLLKQLKEDEEKYKDYPWLYALGIPIYYEGKISYVLGEDIKKALNKRQLKLYSEYYGVQTGIMTKDGKFGQYVHDSEAVLCRIFTNELTDTQLFWD